MVLSVAESSAKNSGVLILSPCNKLGSKPQILAFIVFRLDRGWIPDKNSITFVILGFEKSSASILIFALVTISFRSVN